VVAQLGAPDMRTPIQYALSWPNRARGVSDKLDVLAMSQLDFEPPDLEKFPALRLAYDVIELGGAAGAVFNAANEAAVHAFLNHQIPFGKITKLSSSALKSLIGDRRQSPLRDLAEVVEADRTARALVEQSLPAISPIVAAPRLGVSNV